MDGKLFLFVILVSICHLARGTLADDGGTISGPTRFSINLIFTLKIHFLPKGKLPHYGSRVPLVGTRLAMEDLPPGEASL